MTIESRINKIKNEMETIKHTPYKNWVKKTVMSVKLRILKRKLHKLQVDLNRHKYDNFNYSSERNEFDIF